MKGLWTKRTIAVVLGALLCISFGANVVFAAENRQIRAQMSSQRQRELSDVVAAMADIEVNLQKLMIASGASQSVKLLGETALLAQHVESGLSRLPMRVETAVGAMKFAGQMGDYTLTLATQMSGGSMLTSDDERQLGDLLVACRALNEHLNAVSAQLYAEPVVEQAGGVYGEAALSWPEEAIAGDSAIEYPSLIYDGPFSDSRAEGARKGLTGERVSREQAREAAAWYAGTTLDRVRDAADSGGQFEAFGFEAETDHGVLSVQITGVGGHLLWMMPQEAEYAVKLDRETCLQNARSWLLEKGFGEMEVCFVQQYDGMIVANFAAVQDGVLLYPDQVKVQIAMDSGAVVGAECSQYWMNHVVRDGLEAALSMDEARQMLSERLEVLSGRLCVIPGDAGEALCWGFEGTFAGETYWAFIDAHTGEARDILRVAHTQDGETAI